MKISVAFLLICTLLFSNCTKNTPTPDVEVDPTLIKTTPFENADLKLERVGMNLPDFVTKIHFFDESNGVCLSSAGSLYSTTDRGVTWKVNLDLVKVANCLGSLGFHVIDDQTIVAFMGVKGCTSTDPLSRANLIFRTQNRGKTWTTDTIRDTQLRGMTLGTDKNLYFISENNGIPDYKSYFHTSTDAGLTWNKKFFITAFAPLANVIYLSSKQMRVVGPPTNLHNPYSQSTDNGLTWEYIHPGAGSDHISGVSLGDSARYYLTYHNGTTLYNVFQNIKGSDTWSNIRSLKNVCKEVKFVSPKMAIIWGNGNKLTNAGFSYTLDTGKTWTDLNFEEDGQFITSTFYDAKNGYVVGSKNVLYKITMK
jgi:photosystem II stability/assembly factor-like uncharacterized protein